MDPNSGAAGRKNILLCTSAHASMNLSPETWASEKLHVPLSAHPLASLRYGVSSHTFGVLPSGLLKGLGSHDEPRR